MSGSWELSRLNVCARACYCPLHPPPAGDHIIGISVGPHKLKGIADEQNLVEVRLLGLEALGSVGGPGVAEGDESFTVPASGSSAFSAGAASLAGLRAPSATSAFLGPGHESVREEGEEGSEGAGDVTVG
jgi:hypothetical protein